MKKDEIPQDQSLPDFKYREMCYATDENGEYTTALSNGWEVKANALKTAWEDIEERIKDAKNKVAVGECSPILYYMEMKLMDITILSAYTGFWKWQVKRHLKPSVFKKLSDKKLGKYATLFEISVEDLKNFKGIES